MSHQRRWKFGAAREQQPSPHPPATDQFPRDADIYRALALFDVLGLYVEQGWADRWTVLDEWARSLSAYREPKRLWVAARWPQSSEARWPHYDRLASSAAKYVEQGRPSWGVRQYLDWRDKVRRTRRRLA